MKRTDELHVHTLTGDIAGTVPSPQMTEQSSKEFGRSKLRIHWMKQAG